MTRGTITKINEYDYLVSNEMIKAYEITCRYIGEGMTITKAINTYNEKDSKKVGAKITFEIFRRIRSLDKEYMHMYISALEEKAERKIDTIEEMIKDISNIDRRIISGVDASLYKTQLTVLQWLAKCYNPFIYGRASSLLASDDDNDSTLPAPMIILNETGNESKK